MTIQVLYFAALRDLAGKSQDTLALPAEARTIADLRAHLERALPALSGRLASIRWARNEVFVPLDTMLQEGDVVALIPPVAGG